MVKNIRHWAGLIRKHGAPGDTARTERIMMFKNMMLLRVLLLSPVSSVIAIVKILAQRNSLLKDVDYFKHLRYEKDRI